ncbi:uncharacterized protein F4822DRAFT_429825 [Hypoxylon trugodes]|uniref:uncharacterized protein n=1 Tax=Hypoxylon trugodes TaxID=326681 RepID=UPI002192D170|nr:uncharacterized protein F4822DRAFT_429825 [Hypoxylon trugodes]KAI1389213.1 hypothetical protein F4822DRAFT_429825 [Hypoxylon trugodes]
MDIVEEAMDLLRHLVDKIGLIEARIGAIEARFVEMETATKQTCRTVKRLQRLREKEHRATIENQASMEKKRTSLEDILAPADVDIGDIDKAIRRLEAELRAQNLDFVLWVIIFVALGVSVVFYLRWITLSTRS